MQDITQCQFCGKTFTELSNRSKHFGNKKTCNMKLRQLAKERLIPTKNSILKDNIMTYEECPNPPNSIPKAVFTVEKLAYMIKCIKCNKSFKGNAAFFHHKVI